MKKLFLLCIVLFILGCSNDEFYSEELCAVIDITKYDKIYLYGLDCGKHARRVYFYTTSKYEKYDVLIFNGTLRQKKE